MPRPPYDPRRRNRNIGTENQGYREQGPFVVPDNGRMGLHCEYLDQPRLVTPRVHGVELPVLVERPRKGHRHPASPDDIAHMLNLLPVEFSRGEGEIAMVVLRQPTRKQQRLDSVWGRLMFYAEVENYSGPAIFLEAQPDWWRYSFARKLSLEQQGELRRMEQLVGRAVCDRRGHHFSWGPRQLRRWVLFHTLLHEIGHWVDYLETVTRPYKRGEQGWSAGEDRYFSRPRSEREAVAHRFSDAWRDSLIRRGELGFPPLGVIGEARARLDPAWFVEPDGEAEPPIPPVQSGS